MFVLESPFLIMRRVSNAMWQNNNVFGPFLFLICVDYSAHGWIIKQI